MDELRMKRRRLYAPEVKPGTGTGKTKKKAQEESRGIGGREREEEREEEEKREGLNWPEVNLHTQRFPATIPNQSALNCSLSVSRGEMGSFAATKVSASSDKHSSIHSWVLL